MLVGQRVTAIFGLCADALVSGIGPARRAIALRPGLAVQLTPAAVSRAPMAGLARALVGQPAAAGHLQVVRRRAGVQAGRDGQRRQPGRGAGLVDEREDLIGGRALLAGRGRGAGRRGGRGRRSRGGPGRDRAWRGGDPAARPDRQDRRSRRHRPERRGGGGGRRVRLDRSKVPTGRAVPISTGTRSRPHHRYGVRRGRRRARPGSGVAGASSWRDAGAPVTGQDTRGRPARARTCQLTVPPARQ